MGKDKMTAEERRLAKEKKRKITKVLEIIGYVICGILILATIIAALVINKLGILPVLLIVLLTLLVIALSAIFIVTQRWLGVGIFTKIIALIMIVVLLIGTNYVRVTQKALDKMTGVTTQISNVHIYVLADDPAKELQDAKDYTFGILATMDRQNTDKVVEDINTKLDTTIPIVEYNNASEMITGLYNGEVKAMVLNDAYINIVKEMEGFEDVESRIRSISTNEIVVEVSTEKKPAKEYTGEEILAVYISGNDCVGVPEINGNSDVNIILMANLETRQILLVSTPRDFYVPLSISDGQKDKLTHAGVYGVDVSVETLEMLYDVEIDHYVKVNFTGFVEIIDALGGVNVYSEFDFYTENIHYSVGYNQLSGYEALMFARNRGAFSDGDRQRGKNQMAVIEAVIDEMATSNMLKNYDEVLGAVSDSMITSMSYEEITNLVKFQLDDMRGWEVLKYSVNGYDSFNTTYSMGSAYVMEPDYETVEQAKSYIKDMYDGKKIVIK